MMNPEVKTSKMKIKVKWRDVKQARQEEVKEKEKIRVSALEVHEKTVKMIIKLNQALGSPREVQEQCWNELVLSVSQMMANARIDDSMKVLCFAQNGNNIQVFKLLQDNFRVPSPVLDKEQLSGGHNLLHRACSEGWFELVQELVLNQSMDVNKQEFDSAFTARCTAVTFAPTPLMYAVMFDYINIVNFLLNHPNTDTTLKESSGLSILDLAIKKNSLDMTKLLLDHPSIDTKLMDRGIGLTLLHLAMKMNSLDIMKLLLSHPKVDIDKMDKHWKTSLLTATKMKCGENIDLEILELLLSQPNIDIEAKDENGMTVLHIATSKGSMEMVTFFLKRGANPGGILDIAVMRYVKTEEWSAFERSRRRRRRFPMRRRVLAAERLDSRYSRPFSGLVKYLLVDVGLPVTKDVLKLSLKLPSSDPVLAAINKAMVRPPSLKILARRSVWTLPQQAHNLLPRPIKKFTEDGTNLSSMLKHYDDDEADDDVVRGGEEEDDELWVPDNESIDIGQL